MSNDLRALRESLGFNQNDMASRMGLTLRAYSDIERGVSKLRPIHRLAAERIALTVAVEHGNPMLAPESVRREALEVARLITG